MGVQNFVRVIIKEAVLHCESEYNRGAGCGKTARPELHGGLCENEVPTITILLNIDAHHATLAL